MKQRPLTSIQRTEGQNHKPAGSLSSKERRKIQSRNRCLRTYNRRSTISETKQKMKTNSIIIHNNVTSGKKQWNLQQGTTSNSRSLNEVETISVGCNGILWNLDRPWKLKILPGTLQVK